MGNKAYITLPVGYTRVDNGPLLEDQVFNSIEDATAFANGPTSYIGQIFSVIVDGKPIIYMIGSNKAIKKISMSELENDLDVACIKTVSELPDVGVSNTIYLNSLGEGKYSANVYLNNAWIEIGTSGQGSSEEIDSLKSSVTALNNSIATLNGDETIEGSISKKIKDSIPNISQEGGQDENSVMSQKAITDLLNNKQNKLIAGANISINNETNEISATGGGGGTIPLYGSTGENTDGAMTQKSVTDELNLKQNKQDNSLKTDKKIIADAINEIFSRSYEIVMDTTNDTLNVIKNI